MKKICVVTNKFFPLIGGTELLTKEFIDFFKTDYDVSVITNPYSERNIYDFDYKIFQYDYNNISKEMFELKKFDLVIFFADLHTPYLNTYNCNYGKNNICVLNVDERTYEARYQFQNAIKNLQQFDMVITFCKEAPVNKFLQEFNIKNIFIPNMSRNVFNTSNKFDIKQKFNIKDKKIITCLASYENRKNQLHLLKTIKELSSDKYAWLFVGNISEINYANACMNYVERENMNNIYFIKGTLKSDLIDTILNQSDATILPSIAEGLPLSIIESMAAGTPWISTPVGGINGVFKDLYSGFIFDSINFSAKDLNQSLNKSFSKVRETIRDEWKLNFDKQIIFNKYKKVIEDII
jgi:glycosyltransferase involved in cell wall biosynthesis